ncbi:hypothetical protein GOODEAATRI_009957, partial [Goodea atripinnis]
CVFVACELWLYFKAPFSPFRHRRNDPFTVTGNHMIVFLLVITLTKGNAAIQKIVAFENAFERLLDIITEEGSSDGGIVVEDCLLLLLNLLKNNSSNQNFFKEGSYIQKMKPWFEVGNDNSGWSAQKVTNLHLMLQLCTILMATGVPADILTEVIIPDGLSLYTFIALPVRLKVIRGSQVNQDYFASVNAPSNPPRPAIVVLLMSMVNERQPFVLRCAVLYCFQCFLYKNQKADSHSNWCAAVALAHALQDNLTQKEQLLRVQLATSLGKPPVSLLQQCTNILSQVENCSDNPDTVIRSSDGEKLKQLIEKRIGKENFVEKLGFITKHELYSRAALKPQPVFPSPEQMLFDHEFTRLVKELEGLITKAVHKSSEEEKKEEEVKKTLEQHDNIVTQYKELIREQDAQIQELKEKVVSMTTQTEQLQATVSQQQSQIQQHKDQYNILKLKLGKENQSQSNNQGDTQVNGLQTEELSQLREQLEELRRQQTLLQTQLSEKDAVIDSLKSATQAAEGPAGGSDNTELLQELEALKNQVQSHLAEIGHLKAEKQELQRRAEAASSDTAHPSDNSSDAAKAELESRLAAQMSETEKLKESRSELEKQLASATSTVAILQTEKSKLQTEVQESKKEQDDLLMLLADQDQKIHILKQKLKDLGETVEDEDDIDARDQTSDEEDEDED